MAITIEEVRAFIENMKKEGHIDPERAHGDEDDILYEVLEAIAGGCENPRALAAEALKMRELDFPRWYA